MIRRLAPAALGLGALWRLIATNAITVDLGIGPRLQPLGRLTWTIATRPETVFDVIAAPYVGRTPPSAQPQRSKPSASTRRPD
jgi:hypothetical protein